MRACTLALLILVPPLVLALAACSSASKRIEDLEKSPEPTSARPAEAIRVLDSGFVWGDGSFSYAFTAENTSDDTSMEETYAQVTVYDATGEAVGSDTAVIDFILPGQVVAHAGHIPVPEEPERIALSFTVEREVGVDTVQTFERTEGKFEPTSYGGRVVAAVKNPYERDLRRLHVVAILRSAEGDILNGGAGLLESLPARGESVITIEVLGVMPEPPASVDVYTTFSAETVFRLE